MSYIRLAYECKLKDPRGRPLYGNDRPPILIPALVHGCKYASIRLAQGAFAEEGVEIVKTAIENGQVQGNKLKWRRAKRNAKYLHEYEGSQKWYEEMSDKTPTFVPHVDTITKMSYEMTSSEVVIYNDSKVGVLEVHSMAELCEMITETRKYMDLMMNKEYAGLHKALRKDCIMSPPAGVLKALRDDRTAVFKKNEGPGKDQVYFVECDPIDQEALWAAMIKGKEVQDDRKPSARQQQQIEADDASETSTLTNDDDDNQTFTTAREGGEERVTITDRHFDMFELSCERDEEELDYIKSMRKERKARYDMLFWQTKHQSKYSTPTPSTPDNQGTRPRDPSTDFPRRVLEYPHRTPNTEFQPRNRRRKTKVTPQLDIVDPKTSNENYYDDFSDGDVSTHNGRVRINTQTGRVRPVRRSARGHRRVNTNDY